jgi:hypothetical protein
MVMHIPSFKQPRAGCRLQRGRATGGFALLLVIGFLAVSMIVLGGLLSWTSQNALLTQRHQDYQSTLAVQNVAGEFAVARMRADLREGGLDAVIGNWLDYPFDILDELEQQPEWADHEFAIQIEAFPGPGIEPRWSVLHGTYGGLQVWNQEFIIRSGARWDRTTPPMAVAAEEWVQVAEIPVFAFAALYEFDLTFITPPTQNTTLSGRVHGNMNLYTHPSGTLVFGNHVTAGATNHHELHPNDSSIRIFGTIIYEQENGGHLGRLHVPGAGNDVRGAIESGYLSRADLIIRVTDGGILAEDRHGIPKYVTSFVRTAIVIEGNGEGIGEGNGEENGQGNGEPETRDIVFFDQRELKLVRAVDVDIETFRLPWIYDDLGSPRILWVEDQRTILPETMPGIRLVHGAELPEAGLTVVTPNPLYIRGNYNNLPWGGPARPSAIVADAVTILSTNWDDAQHGGEGTNQTGTPAGDTTVNGAILTGIVPSEGEVFDGGFFNALRMLEDWRTRTLTFHGSVVALYRSRQAIEPWRADVQVYYAPVRQWSFDPQYLQPGHLPWTPVVCTLLRLDWGMLPPSSLFGE